MASDLSDNELDDEEKLFFERMNSRIQEPNSIKNEEENL
jgi:hypothetical protein